MSPAQPLAALGLPQPVCILRVSCRVATVVYASSAPPSSVCPRPPVRCIVVFSPQGFEISPLHSDEFSGLSPLSPSLLRYLISVGQNCRRLRWFVSFSLCSFVPSLGPNSARASGPCLSNKLVSLCYLYKNNLSKGYFKKASLS